MGNWRETLEERQEAGGLPAPPALLPTDAWATWSRNAAPVPMFFFDYEADQVSPDPHGLIVVASGEFAAPQVTETGLYTVSLYGRPVGAGATEEGDYFFVKPQIDMITPELEPVSPVVDNAGSSTSWPSPAVAEAVLFVTRLLPATTMIGAGLFTEGIVGGEAWDIDLGVVVAQLTIQRVG